ncbi:MAG TPA: DinB family protein [Chryseosolibacter sp.]
MKRPEWFERQFQFGLTPAMLPFFLERLEGTMARLEKKVSDVPDSLLVFQPGGKWSIKQQIGHLAEVSQIITKRLGEIVAGISPMSPAVFEPKLDYNSQPVSTVLEYFAESRMSTLKAYQNLSETDCQKVSLHPRLRAMMNPVDLAYFDAEHDDHHLLKITDIKNSKKN